MDIYKELSAIGAIKFGNFILKSEVKSPIYVDLRVCLSYPKILKKIALMIKDKLKTISFDHILGVPYSGIFFACAFSSLVDAKMLLIRKEVKEYGLKKPVEGTFRKGDSCLIIEDVVTTGKSLLNTIQLLKNEGIVVEHALTILDRGNHTEDKFLKVDCKLHSLLNIFGMLENLKKDNFIDQKMYKQVLEFTNNMESDAII